MFVDQKIVVVLVAGALSGLGCTRDRKPKDNGDPPPSALEVARNQKPSKRSEEKLEPEAKKLISPSPTGAAVEVNRLPSEDWPPETPNQAWVIPLEAALWCGGRSPCTPCFPLQNLIQRRQQEMQWLVSNLDGFELPPDQREELLTQGSGALEALNQMNQIAGEISGAPLAQGCSPPPPPPPQQAPDHRSFVEADFCRICQLPPGTYGELQIGSKALETFCPEEVVSKRCASKDK